MDETKADAPLAPDEERALREAWACIGAWEPWDGQEPGATYKCPLCDGEGETEGVILDATKPCAATLGAYGIGPGLAAAELVAGSTGRLLATLDQVRADVRARETEIAEVRREKAELAARVDGAVAWVDLLRDVARHERDVYAYDIARIRDALRLDAGASLGDVVQRAEELAADKGKTEEK